VIDTGEEEVIRTGGHGAYRFEAAWVEEEDCKVVVKEAWEAAKARSDLPVYDALEMVAGDLVRWGTNVLGSLEKRVKSLKKELERCRRGVLNQEMVSREGVLRYRLDKAQEQIDMYWKQRAHIKWLHYGDRNTAFFPCFVLRKKEE
jgi:hypothetical protein